MVSQHISHALTAAHSTQFLTQSARLGRSDELVAMKNAGAIVLLFLAAFAASACAMGPGRGLKTEPQCYPGNIQADEVVCPSNTVMCSVGDIQPGQKVMASCPSGYAAYVKFESDKESVKFYDGSGAGLYSIKAYIKGGNAYCVYYYSSYDTPHMCGKDDKNRCGFSHAFFCVKKH